MHTEQDNVPKTTGSNSRINIIGKLNISNIESVVVSEQDTINNANIVRSLCTLRDD
ncbi:hypothetical protein [Candidatus Enterovibrio escicola]|uniref:Uncharacterized protein n=1 Tax=Candidatus Enterovibrio escicola TaxID=1927127 RepID=A0A2A5T709_9GAMM|nr:hypothetical protein [Candidatus Enterovibrio escacola]PCS23965.1 hypothetical protein BTN49_0331 [Candidatus Enterovibrio escacola]